MWQNFMQKMVLLDKIGLDSLDKFHLIRKDFFFIQNVFY